MMSSVRQLSISTLSPVHIGCDDVYEPSNFVISDGLLHLLDPATLVADLTDQERNDLARLSDEREPIAALQSYFKTNAERFAMLANHKVAVAEAVVNAYEISAGRATQRGPGGQAVFNAFPISRTAYSALDNAPYLPGSSIKGSMRTAWLNFKNDGKPLTGPERDKKDGRASRELQQRVLGYSAGKFEDDPFRSVRLADAHVADNTTTPPTRVLYAVSKKKRLPRDGERAGPELKFFLETVPDALPCAFSGELRFGQKPQGGIDWNALCEACNAFYVPQLQAELAHPVLSAMLDPEWKKLIGLLLAEELNELRQDRQGFLLRVGRHSGAESVTLDGVRSIKILGARVDGKQQFDFRPESTEKRFASMTKAGAAGLLPFGWIWVDASDDAHGHLAQSMRQKLGARSQALRDEHADHLARLDERQAKRREETAERERKVQAEAEARRAEEQAQQQREAVLAAMSPNLRRVEEFRVAFAERAEQLRSRPDNPNTAYHTRARELARDAAAWPMAERTAAADAIEEWLPKVIRLDIKEERKKLKLAALRAP